MIKIADSFLKSSNYKRKSIFCGHIEPPTIEAQENITDKMSCSLNWHRLKPCRHMREEGAKVIRRRKAVQLKAQLTPLNP